MPKYINCVPKLTVTPTLALPLSVIVFLLSLLRKDEDP